MILIDLIDNTLPAITIDISTIFMKWRYQVDDDGKGGVLQFPKQSLTKFKDRVWDQTCFVTWS